MKKCEMCGVWLPPEKSRCRYCTACKKSRAINADRRRNDAAKANNLFSRIDNKIDKIAKNATKAVKKKGLTLTQLLKKLDIENAERRKKGLTTLSYGKYVSMLNENKID